MTTIERSAPVMVTGATGYVAGVLVKKLLEEGLTVHAPVRDPNNPEKLHYLNAIAAASPGEIKYFKADLLDEGSYAEAMVGCELVFHTASPFKLDIQDPQKELVDPAKLGTRNVLETANRTPSVKRVVLTSSCAAIYGDNVDLQKTPNGVFTEEIWNTSSSLEHNPYFYSKTVAEKEAWKINQAQSRWDLVTINPSLVIGPGINPYATSESFTLIKQMGDGTLKSGAPKWAFGAVDVRDLAKAHFQAGFTPEAKGRYIISGHNTDMFSMSQTLLDRYGQNYPIPRKSTPKWLLWLIGPIVDKTMSRQFIARNINLPWKADNSKGIKELGISYRPLAESMNDFFQQIIDNGLVRKNA
ncbi:NAD-dependent epimerase/dehydratase family protein [Roseofilum sp. Guam]|uniref:NAD-dependent epimerase/dehydratase family protein n=1 Tax=Roseofilum sp. Guam TaxID=2821502 RepID=UPI001B17CE08|nr:NAD-dependent epimerase/dehydratase family protein [Roseofilum sp. Guam]MBP0028626.1 NAD-dependent epimerase/dehydratase family protein [Roseofilum sp. Guam]